MKTYLVLKPELPYTDGREILSSEEVEPINVAQDGLKIQVMFKGETYWINKTDVCHKVEKFDKGDKAFDGEFSTTIEKLSSIENPSPEIKEAIKVMKAMENGLEYVLSKGLVSVRKMARVMGCYVEDITGGL